MTLRNTLHRWGAVAQFFHWLIVVLIIVQVSLGKWGEELPIGMKKVAVLARHKSVGISILALVLLRLLWRLVNVIPPLPHTLKAHERVLAHTSHVTLYLLLVALPLSGWMMSSARGFPVSWFGFFQLPDLVPKSRPLYEALLDTHHVLVYVLGVVVTLHVAAAIKHHFWLKDDTLRRMLPLGNSTQGTRR